MRIVAFALIPVAVALPTDSTACGQELRLHASQEWAEHSRLGTPFGLGVGVNVPVSRRAGILVSLEYTGDSFRSTGSTCSGLIPPDADCSPELRDESGRSWGIGLNLPVQVLGTRAFSLNVVPGVRTAWVRSEQEGVESGRFREASTMMYGYELGAEAVLHMTPLPGALYLSGHIGQLLPYQDGVLIDGYSPFQTKVDFGRVRLGWLIRPRS